MTSSPTPAPRTQIRFGDDHGNHRRYFDTTVEEGSAGPGKRPRAGEISGRSRHVSCATTDLSLPSARLGRDLHRHQKTISNGVPARVLTVELYRCGSELRWEHTGATPLAFSIKRHDFARVSAVTNSTCRQRTADNFRIRTDLYGDPMNNPHLVTYPRAPGPAPSTHPHQPGRP